MAPPLSADKLVEALKAEGVKVVGHPGWRDNNRNHKGAWGPVNGTMIHHTGPYSTEAGILEYCFDGSTPLPGPLATGVIGKTGTVYLIGNGRANHAGGGDARVLAAVTEEDYGAAPPAPRYGQGDADAVDGNSHFYGWECVNSGSGNESWPKAQYVAMVKAQAAICRAHGWGAKSVIAHREWSNQKIDPRGIDMAGFRADVAACLAKPAGKWTGSVTPPPLTVEQRLARLEAKVFG
ncbi:peptidoglycan recognition protein family protein [Streptomyces sp. NBC_00490]|uniref:peptidoglycan recognition protein family protein n=1 Tax=Streptomyces sp. NBC_00490 TaxID=2903657 RepID=UPI003FCD3FFA